MTGQSADSITISPDNRLTREMLREATAKGRAEAIQRTVVSLVSECQRAAENGLSEVVLNWTKPSGTKTKPPRVWLNGPHPNDDLSFLTAVLDNLNVVTDITVRHDNDCTGALLTTTLSW
jgi:hypothetical protein